MNYWNLRRVAKLLFYCVILAVLSLQLYWGFRPKPQPLELHLKAVTFQQLPAWSKIDLSSSFKAFQISCHAFLKQGPSTPVGSQFIPLMAQDWYPACNAANAINNPTNQNIRDFFENWFHPVIFTKKHATQGLFTGYYMPLLNGSLTKTDQYSIPLYELPPNLLTAKLASFISEITTKILVGRVQDKKFIPFYSRAEIDHQCTATLQA